ncbi:hypothetical protein [Enterococcus italicus]
MQFEDLSHIKNKEVKCMYCGATYIIDAKHSKIGAELEAELERLRAVEKQEATKAKWEFKTQLIPMVFLFAFFVFCMGSLVIMGIADSLSNVNKISITANESDFVGENYKIVEKKLDDMGFKNIKAEKVKDLTLGILKSKGDVKEVTINGEDDFEEGDYFKEDAKIKIYYHDFKK